VVCSDISGVAVFTVAVSGSTISLLASVCLARSRPARSRCAARARARCRAFSALARRSWIKAPASPLLIISVSFSSGFPGTAVRPFPSLDHRAFERFRPHNVAVPWIQGQRFFGSVTRAVLTLKLDAIHTVLRSGELPGSVSDG